MTRMQEGRPSLTSSIVAMARAVYDAAPRDVSAVVDPYAITLLPKRMQRMAKSLITGWAVGMPHHYALRVLTGGLFEHIALRTAAIDDAVTDAVRAGAKQCVILGAGLDARGFRLASLAGVEVFEVDHPATQKYKQRKVKERPPLGAHRFVAVDFAVDLLLSELQRAGFSPEQPTVWVMEGVTMYLPPAALTATLRDVQNASAPNSRFVVTYMPPLRGVVLGNRWLQQAMASSFSRLGEPLLGRVATEDFHQQLQNHGFAVLTDDAAPEWAAHYTPLVIRVGIARYERLATAVKRNASAT